MVGYRNARRAAGCLALAAVMTALCGGAAPAQQGLPNWSSHMSVTLKGGTERHIGELDLFVPLSQDNDSLFYADLRAQMDDSENLEGNIGFGYRRLGRSVIVGAYGFLDYRGSAETGNDFYQVMAGFEAMTELFDLRLNGYLPEGGEKPASGATSVEVVGGALQMRAGFERALAGGDGEIGVRLWASDSGRSEIRAFAGGFYFDAEDYRTVAGPRGRVEWRMFDLRFLGGGSRFTLGAEVTQDSVRDTQGFAVARLTIPFGGGRRSRWAWLDRRMVDYVVRDVDIMIGSAALGAVESVAYADTGVNAGAVTELTNADNVVTATAGGGVGDLFILDGSAGDFATTQSIVLSSGEVLLGGGATIDLVGLDSGTSVTWTAPGAQAAIQGDVAGGNVIALADNVIVTGLDIENTSLTASSRAIYGNAVSGALVVDNNIATNADSGFAVYLAGGTGNTISGNSIATSGISGYAVYLAGASDNTILGNSIATSGASGNAVYLNGGSGNTVSGNGIATSGDSGFGVFLTTSTGTTVSGNSIATSGTSARAVYLWGSDNNTVSGNSIQTGQAGATGIFLNGTSDNNTGTGNSYTGVAVDCSDAGTGNTIDLCLP